MKKNKSEKLGALPLLELAAQRLLAKKFKYNEANSLTKIPVENGSHTMSALSFENRRNKKIFLISPSCVVQPKTIKSGKKAVASPFRLADVLKLYEEHAQAKFKGKLILAPVANGVDSNHWYLLTIKDYQFTLIDPKSASKFSCCSCMFSCIRTSQPILNLLDENNFQKVTMRYAELQGYTNDTDCGYVVAYMGAYLATHDDYQFRDYSREVAVTPPQTNLPQDLHHACFNLQNVPKLDVVEDHEDGALLVDAHNSQSYLTINC